MKITELNNYIKHYIEHDKTRRAIMLTAPWGSGKSFYIQDKLIPFLAKEENGGYKCIVISLYGINSVSEISKAIYFESKWDELIEHTPEILKGAVGKAIESKSETKRLLQGGARTVIKGITSYLRVNISMDDKSLNNLYKSVNLSNTLIIFEDLERSGLSILEVLGYVYNLVEHDNAKVLIVANEDELLTYESESQPDTQDEKGNHERVLTGHSLQYLKTKEKVICDTIYFQGDYETAIRAIIQLFENETLLRFSSTENINDILDIMYLTKCFNLRTFMYACQKAADLYSLINKDDFAFNQTVFYSLVAFSTRIKNGEIPLWKGTELVSSDLGISKYPLYKFCYDYIRWQEFKIDEVEKALDAHKKMILYNQHGSNNDPDLSIVFNYHIHNEREVQEALLRVESRLNDPESIPFYDYRKLAFHLIKLHFILGYDYSSCKEKMINNISGKSNDIDQDILFFQVGSFENEREEEKYKELIDELKSSLNTNSVEFFSYNPEDLRSFYDYVKENERKFASNHRFISNFDLNRLVDMLFISTSEQIHCFRDVLYSIYRYANKSIYSEEDVVFMRELKEKINDRLNNNDNGREMDRIILLQLRWVIGNLDEFIAKLSE